MWKGVHTSSIRGIGHAWRVAGNWSVDLGSVAGGAGVEPGRRRKAIGRLRQSDEFCITWLGGGREGSTLVRGLRAGQDEKVVGGQRGSGRDHGDLGR